MFRPVLRTGATPSPASGSAVGATPRSAFALFFLLVGLTAATGCDREEATADSPESPRGRVNAVQAKQEEEAPPPDAFCDKHFAAADADPFEFAELTGDPPPPADQWRWVNIWATWCKPCIEEMPYLVDWRDKLADRGLSDLVLVSVDESREVVEEFRNDHPETPESLLISEPDAVKPWIDELGLHREAPLPVHVFVDPDGRVRCLRAGGVGEDEYAAVERLVTGQ